MRAKTSRRAFTLIELLTVIAIIAILAALLFPLAGTLREQARATDCFSKLHQLYVSARVFKEDEGNFPACLYGYVEQPNGDPMTDPGSQAIGRADRIIHGFLFRQQIKDSTLFICPDNRNGKVEPLNPSEIDQVVTVAHFPPVQSVDPNSPNYWPPGHTWIGDVLAATGCPTDAAGTIDCWNDITAPRVSPSDPRYLKPKYYYKLDSYDASPRVDVDGTPIFLNGLPVYDVHYSLDWTGSQGVDKVSGLTDLVFQFKYENPPPDRTLLTYCTYHASLAHAKSFTAIAADGTAKKIDLKKALARGPLVFN